MKTITTGLTISTVCAMLMTALAPVAQAQAPKVNTHGASPTRAAKTVKANVRKADGAIETAGRKTENAVGKDARKVGKGISSNGRKVENAIGKDTHKIGKALTPRHH